MTEPARHPVPNGPPPNPNPRRPALSLPPGACDSHVHVFGPFDRFPVPEDRGFTPNEAPEAALRRLHDHLGIARAVIVQSQGHGFDHRPLLDALRTGAGRYRGVALVRPGDDPAEIARWADAGICGVRLNYMAHLANRLTTDDMRAVLRLVAPHGWHVGFHVGGTQLLEAEPFIRTIDADVVIDHMARPDLAEGPDGPVATALRRLLDTGRVWVKLSGTERLSKAGPPYGDALPYAAALARHAPERVLWGTDWPHVNLHGPMPDDGELVDLLEEIAPTDEARRRLLVENPAAFFGFPA